MKFLISFILFIYVFASTPFLELVKLPQLYTHYIDHKKENQQMTFTEFLYLHYGDEAHAEDHNSLPFKSCNYIYFLILEMPANVIIVKCHEIQKKIDTPLRYIYESLYIFQYLNTIWQPPRL
ncbi:MAG: hypothetical protein JNL75_04080 [Chitinophagales bacterium]|nr:hypothetical protein [Chitinophagales bacterium]